MTGTVIDKHHYQSSTQQLEHPIMVGKAIISEPLTIPAQESWTLIVQDAKGHKHEVYVDSMTWNTTEVGATWPGKSA